MEALFKPQKACHASEQEDRSNAYMKAVNGLKEATNTGQCDRKCF